METKDSICKCCNKQITDRKSNAKYCKVCKDCHDNLYSNWSMNLKSNVGKNNRFNQKMREAGIPEETSNIVIQALEDIEKERKRQENMFYKYKEIERKREKQKKEQDEKRDKILRGEGPWKPTKSI